MGVRTGTIHPWILKFDVFLVNFRQKRLFVQFRVGNMKLHNFFPLEKSFD